MMLCVLRISLMKANTQMNLDYILSIWFANLANNHSFFNDDIIIHLNTLSSKYFIIQQKY